MIEQFLARLRVATQGAATAIEEAVEEGGLEEGGLDGVEGAVP